MVVNFGLEMKTKVAVPNSQISKDSTESESKAKRSGDERSIGSTETSSPVIKVYGSLERVALEATLETTEAADRINPNGAIKSDLNGMSEKDAPVSRTIGRVGAVGTESEIVVVVTVRGLTVEATTVGAVEATAGDVGAVATVAVATEVVGAIAEGCHR